MSRFDDEVRRRLRSAASEIERLPAEPAADAIRAGRRVRRARVASFASAGIALAAVVATVAVSVPGPAPPRDGSIAAAPSVSPRPRGTARAAVPPAAGPSATPGPSLGPPPAPSADATADPERQAIVAFGCEPLEPEPLPEGANVELTLPKTTVARGEPVSMVLRVRNGGPEALEYSRNTTQTYDFWVSDGERTIWLWSRGHRFFAGPSANEQTISPGQEVTSAEVWDQSVCAEAAVEGPPPPGRYVARALWRTVEGGWWSNPVPFEIT